MRRPSELQDLGIAVGEEPERLYIGCELVCLGRSVDPLVYRRRERDEVGRIAVEGDILPHERLRAFVRDDPEVARTQQERIRGVERRERRVSVLYRLGRIDSPRLRRDDAADTGDPSRRGDLKVVRDAVTSPHGRRDGIRRTHEDVRASGEVRRREVAVKRGESIV